MQCGAKQLNPESERTYTLFITSYGSPASDRDELQCRSPQSETERLKTVTVCTRRKYKRWPTTGTDIPVLTYGRTRRSTSVWFQTMCFISANCFADPELSLSLSRVGVNALYRRHPRGA